MTDFAQYESEMMKMHLLNRPDDMERPRFWQGSAGAQTSTEVEAIDIFKRLRFLCEDIYAQGLRHGFDDAMRKAPIAMERAKGRNA